MKSKMISTNTSNAAALIPILLVATMVANAAEYDASVRAGIGASDNIARAAQNDVNETITTLGFDFAVSEQTSRMDLDLRSQFDYVDYSDGTFDSEWIGGLAGLVRFTMIDERLIWIVRDNFGQALRDPLQPARPNNRENVNYLTTGPSIRLLSGSRNSIDVDLRYTRFDFELRPNDNERLSAALSVGREISRESKLSINLKAERVEFDNGGLTAPIEEHEAYARYEILGNRSTLGFEVGYNEVEFAGSEGDGILARVDYSRQTSANGEVTISGGSQFSDQGNIFRFYNDITSNLHETTDISDSPAPFQNNFFALAYTLDQARYSIDASIDWNQEDYTDGQGIDRDVIRGNLVLSREVTRTIFAGAKIGFMRREYKNLLQPRRDDDLILGLNIGYRISAGFDLAIEYQHFQRNSITPGADFTENRAFLLASYTPVWSR